ncbi:MAG: hypothetical protein U0X41_12885 [Chitinophagales bacterium]
MEERNITEQESLAIIQEMINKSKKQLTDRSKYFMMWGVAVFACAIIQYFLLRNLQPHTQMVWLSMPVLAVIQLSLSIRDRKKEKVLSHNTAAIGSVWLALGISFFILAFLSSRISFDMFPFLILLYGIGTFITGRIIQFKPLIFGGLACFMLCVLITYVEGPEKLLILALSVLLSYIIPGILLKREFNQQERP